MRVICTVESMNYSACGLQVGDWFALSEDAVTVPEGTAFCYFAIQQVITVVHGHLAGPQPDGYLRGGPLIMCPDPPEALRMRVEVDTAASPVAPTADTPPTSTPAAGASQQQ